MIVTVGSVRCAPGATSWALLLASAWPAVFGTERVVLEADLDGGVLGARYQLGVDPGAASLVATLRRSPGEPVDVTAHGREAGVGVWIVPGPETAERVRALWSTSAPAVAERLAADGRVWMVDVGRATPEEPVFAFVEHAELAIVVCGSGHEDLVQIPARVDMYRRSGVDVGVLVVGKPGYPQPELAGFFGTSLVWIVDRSDDLLTLAGQMSQPGRARRSWLWRNAVDVAARVAAHTHHTSTSLATRPAWATGSGARA